MTLLAREMESYYTGMVLIDVERRALALFDTKNDEDDDEHDAIR